MTETQTRLLNLGEIIDALAALPPTMRAYVMFKGILLSPDGVDSYRGSYDHLTIEPAYTTDERTVADLHSCLVAADGQTIEGWKGGQMFLMHRGTPVVVSPYYHCSQEYVTGVEVRDGAAVIVTEKATY